MLMRPFIALLYDVSLAVAFTMKSVAPMLLMAVPSVRTAVSPVLVMAVICARPCTTGTEGVEVTSSTAM